VSAALWRWLPRGSRLPDDVWRGRHRAITALLIAHAPGLLAFGLLTGEPVGRTVTLACMPLVAAAVACLPELGRAWRSCAAVLGLMLCSSSVVALSGGATEAHFHFFVMVPVMALYEEWLPFGLGVVYVLIEHGVLGTLDSQAVYSSSGSPWDRAAIHAAFFAAACGGALVNWRLHERARDRRDALDAQLAHQAGHDALTGLPNRAALLDAGARLFADPRLQGRGAAVLILDLDRFREVNDTLGHAYGDHLLIEVATRLTATLDGGRMFARLGGDEFAVLLTDVDAVAAEEFARQLRLSLSGNAVIDGIGVDVDVSIGVGVAECGTVEMGRLLQQADVAMYQAKRIVSGVCVYDPAEDVNTRERITLLGDLRRAIDDGELVIHLQPKVDAVRRELAGVEVLVRWQHPELGLLPPGRFVPAVEHTGLVLPMTYAVLDLALAWVRGWLDRGRRIEVAVNLSTRCLGDEELPDRIAAALEAHGVPADLLRMEITESAIITNISQAREIVTRIHGLGVRFSIDDFGTGYSSMNYLRRAPIDEVKVDRSFVMAMLANEEDHTLVRSTIDLGHSLGLKVCAEGVEDQDTLDELVRLGCDLIQGYHLAKPMSAEALEEWIASCSAGGFHVPPQRDSRAA
jgi:diguanylate cyclase (GGDEF)-like protein